MKKEFDSIEGKPLIGDKFPDLEVQTTRGKMSIPKFYRTKWFVLFSHPADFTPVCTTEFVSFARRQEDFKKINCELIGLSMDQVFSHIKWLQWIKENLNEEIKFPVIADEMGRVANKLGMLHPSKGNGTVRAVFIVDPDSTIRLMLYYPPEVGRNMDEIFRAVKALQAADRARVAIPSGWPKNELIQNKVIIPPPTDETVIQERANKYDGFDWWFCYKDLD